ncbi:cytochrome b5 family heme/steroid binding domain-containing protein, partial [Toxoplasma gondii MAS]
DGTSVEDALVDDSAAVAAVRVLVDSRELKSLLHHPLRRKHPRRLRVLVTDRVPHASLPLPLSRKKTPRPPRRSHHSLSAACSPPFPAARPPKTGSSACVVCRLGQRSVRLLELVSPAMVSARRMAGGDVGVHCLRLDSLLDASRCCSRLCESHSRNEEVPYAPSLQTPSFRLRSHHQTLG